MTVRDHPAAGDSQLDITDW